MHGTADHQSTEPPDGRLRALVSVVLVALVTALVVLVATLAASTGPSEVFAGSGPTARLDTPAPPPTPTPPPVEQRESDTDRRLDQRSGESLAWVGTVVRALLLALLVVAVVLALVFFPRRRRPAWARSALEENVDADFGLVDAVAAVSSALVDDAAEQDAALRAGAPRNGIVEAWLRFEVQADRAGVARKQWETSTEFTLRLLDSVSADPAATDALSALYRLARFSDHEVGEVEREAAAAALRQIRHRLAGSREHR